MEIEGSAWNGSINALALDIEDNAGLFVLSDCDLSLLNISHDLNLPYGTFNMVIIDWTDDPTCSLMIEQTLSVEDPVLVEQTLSVEDPVLLEQTLSVEDPVLLEQTLSVEDPVLEEQTLSVEDPVFVEQTLSVEDPVLVEQTLSVEDPVLLEQTLSVEDPVLEEQTLSVEDPVLLEQTLSVEDPVLEEQTLNVEDPVLLEQTLSVEDPITSLNMSDLPDLAVRNETQLELVNWLVDGTDLDVSSDWKDGSVSSISCVNSSELSVVVFNYTYDTIGAFAVSVIASNVISGLVTNEQTVSVFERIHDLIIDGDSTVLAPSSGSWTVSTGPDQGPLENIVCVWNVGTNYLDTVVNVAWLNASTSLSTTFSYAEADAGTQIISINCSNPVSDQFLSMNVSVIWDNVILGELNCTSSTFWNFPITCQLTIERFGNGACFEWDMGDGSPVVYYRDNYCIVSVPTASPTYVQVCIGLSWQLCDNF